MKKTWQEYAKLTRRNLKPKSPSKRLRLIANFEVATGKVIFPTVQETRTEADFLAHIQQLVASDPQGQWIFIADQLNTHKSASLVKWIAEQCGIEEELGGKRQRRHFAESGIKSRIFAG